MHAAEASIAADGLTTAGTSDATDAHDGPDAFDAADASHATGGIGTVDSKGPSETIDPANATDATAAADSDGTRDATAAHPGRDYGLFHGIKEDIDLDPASTDGRRGHLLARLSHRFEERGSRRGRGVRENVQDSRT